MTHLYDVKIVRIKFQHSASGSSNIHLTRVLVIKDHSMVLRDVIFMYITGDIWKRKSQSHQLQSSKWNRVGVISGSLMDAQGQTGQPPDTGTPGVVLHT